MKVSELQGAELDYWVAALEGWCGSKREWEGFKKQAMSPLGWAAIGPIIEREKIEYAFYPDHIRAIKYDDLPSGERLIPDVSSVQEGNTILEAAMRCYVASKYDDEIAET